MVVEAEQGGSGQVVERSRRRMLIVVVVVVGAVAAGLFALMRPGGLLIPDVPGSLHFGTVQGPPIGEPEKIEAPDYRGAFQWRFEPGGEFGLWFSVQNHGDRAITVLDLPGGFQPGPFSLHSVDVSESMNGDGCCVPEDWRPIERLVLEPGDMRMLRLTYRFAGSEGCEIHDDQAPATWTMGTSLLEYAVPGGTHTYEFELPKILAVQVGPDCLTESD